MYTNPYSLPGCSGLCVAPRVREALMARRYIFTCSVQLRAHAYYKWSDLLVQLSDKDFRSYMDVVATLGPHYSR